MLALSKSPAAPSVHMPSILAPSSATMSLAILPSAPIGYSPAAVPQLLTPGPSPSKRPKLTLDTSATPSAFGNGATSLRLETLSATSPTIRNTFENGYHTVQQLRIPAAKRPILQPLATDVPPDTTRKPTPLRTEVDSSFDSAASTPSSNSAVSASSTSTADSIPVEVPYKAAYNVVSILSNSPLPKTRVRRSRFSPSMPMFPAAKKVTFKAQLTEEIKTTEYTLAHSDIDASTSTISILELPAPEYPVRQGPDSQQRIHPEDESTETNAAASKVGEKRESSEEEDGDDDDDAYPTTPIAGRRKRQREWVWTLGPVGAAAEQAKPDEADATPQTERTCIDEAGGRVAVIDHT